MKINILKVVYLFHVSYFHLVKSMFTRDLIPSSNNLKCHFCLSNLLLFLAFVLLPLKVQSQQDFDLSSEYESRKLFNSSHLVSEYSQVQPCDFTAKDSNITFIGQWAWGPCSEVEVQNQYAYISNGSLLQVLDISTPSNPIIVGETIVNGFIDMQISNQVAYLAGNAALTTVDVSDPRDLVVLGSLEIPAAQSILVSGDYAYVGDYPGYLHIIDVSNPVKPIETSKAFLSDEGVVGIGISGDYAYVATYGSLRIEIWDVSDPYSPQYKGYYFIGGAGGDIEIIGDLLYCGTSSFPQFQVVDISEPVNPELIAGLKTPLPIDIDVIENIAYLSSSDSMIIIDISLPTAPERKGSLGRSGSLYSIFGPLAVCYNSVLIAAKTGLWILDGSDIQNPSETLFFTTGETVQDISVVDDTAYVANGHAGLWIIDVTDPVAPQKVGHLHSKGFVSCISLVGDCAFLLNYLSSLWIVDVSNRNSPAELGRLDIDGNSLAVTDTLAFITIPDSGLAVVDVSDPGNPERIGFCSLLGGVEDVEVSGNYAYVGTSIDGLHIIDISDPRHPLEIDDFRGGAVAPLVIAGNYIYAAYNGRVFILDISVPSQVCVAGSTEALFYQYPQDMTIAENYVSLTVGFPSIKTIDVSSPESPEIVGYYGDWGGGYCIEAAEEYLYWGYGPGGFFILRNDLITEIQDPVSNNTPNSYTLLQNYPNPFNDFTTFQYDIPIECHVNLSVYNIIGQKVATLVNEFQQKGRHKIRLNTKNLTSGIYFYKLSAAGNVLFKKMVLIR
jgi:hypothetical protein